MSVDKVANMIARVRDVPCRKVEVTDLDVLSLLEASRACSCPITISSEFLARCSMMKWNRRFLCFKGCCWAGR